MATSSQRNAVNRGASIRRRPLPSSKKPPMRLTAREQAGGEQVAHSRTLARHLGDRTTMMVRLAAGVPNAALALEVRWTRKRGDRGDDRWFAAQDKRRRRREVSAIEFRQTLETILTDPPRPGASPTVPAEQVCQMRAFAGQKPGALGLPFTTLDADSTCPGGDPPGERVVDFSRQWGSFFNSRRMDSRLPGALGSSPPRTSPTSSRTGVTRGVRPMSRPPRWRSTGLTRSVRMQ